MNANSHLVEPGQRSMLLRRSNHSATFRLACALLLAAGCVTLNAGVARATLLNVVLQPFAVVDNGTPSTFGFSSTVPLVAVTGMVQVTTSIIGVFADGARNGASLTPSGANLVTGGLFDSGNVFHAVNNVGGAASFAGAEGTAGVVQIAGGSVIDIGTPSTFGFLFTQPISVSGTVNSQSNFGAVVMDLLADGASMTGNTPAGRLSTFAVNNTTHTQLGASFSAVGLAGSQLDSGVAAIGCNLAPCSNAEIGFDFILSGGGDGAALLGRQEIGGDTISGVVMQLYTLTSQANVFDCGLAGCNASQFAAMFTGSGGSDSYGFIVRQEISTIAAVPEPASIALVGLGLAVWFATRRRVAGDHV